MHELMHSETFVKCSSSENHTKIAELFILTSRCLAGEERVPPMLILDLHCALSAFGSAPL